MRFAGVWAGGRSHRAYGHGALLRRTVRSGTYRGAESETLTSTVYRLGKTNSCAVTVREL